eukprot:s4210_g2.t3
MRPNILGIVAIVVVHTEAASKHGFKVPPFLNCEGPTFHPIWSVFRESAIANAQAGYPRNESLREMAVDLITTFEPSMLLGARAWVVQLRSAATGDIYHLRQSQLGTADDVAFTLASTNIGLQENLGRQTSTQQAETDPAGFCLYGYVQALFIEFRHTIPLQEEGSELPSNDPRLAGCHDRRPLLDVAEQLLGGETCETDFLESSDWPLKTFDLHLSLHSTLSLHSSSDCHVLFDMNDYISRPHEGSWRTTPQLDFKPQKPLQSLRIAAFGLHVASTLEPVAALSEALRTSSPDGNLEVSYFGHPCYGRPGDKSLRHACVYKCQMLGSPCEDDAVADILKGMFNSSGFYEEVPWSIQDALAALGRAWQDADAGTMDLVVCSGPLVLCYLLDVLAPSKLMVMTLCSQLLWGAPPGEHVGAMLLGQVRMMRALAACNVFAASQCLYQTGIELPVVERVAHYLPPAVSWGPHESHWKEVLVLRARYWHRLPGQYFMDVLEAFLRLNEFSHNFTFVMAASFGPDELPPDEIAGYRATVLVPNDLTVFAFVEVYALGVPTFVPEASWLYRLRRAAPFGFLQPSMALPDLTGIHGNFRYPPFLTAKNDLEDLKTFLHWQQTSELHTRPHVQQFGSIPQLLHLTASADLLQISKGMREHSAKLRREAADFWTSMLHRFEALRTALRPEVQTDFQAKPAPVLSSFKSSGDVICNGGNGGNENKGQGELRAFLDCSAEEHGAWNSFRHAFQSNAAAGFSINWELQAMAQSLWNSVQGSPQDFAAASALFHQVLIGDAPVDLAIRSGHCHYGLVAALLILARHDSHGNAVHYSAMALQMLGGFAALDFLEDSAWPFSSLDLTSLAILQQSAKSPGDEGKCPLFSRMANFGRVRSIIEDRIPWSSLSHRIRHNLPVGYEVPDGKWKVAVVGVHPSLSADIAFAVKAALRGRTEHQYFGLSCPAHHSAVHHCSFRCEVLGQCSNDAIFDVILGQMLNFADFTQKSFDQQVLTQELRDIVSSNAFLKSADLQICTGPYFLCHMLQQILDAPLLIYMGLTMTYMAPSYAVKEMLDSARSIASDFTWMGSQGVRSRRTAIVATDLIRAAQFHHAVGVWIAALPPLSLYQSEGLASKTTRNLEAIALRPELWRRAAFFPALRIPNAFLADAMLGCIVSQCTVFLWSPLFVDSAGSILSYSAAILVPWDNDVMSFYELYHAAMPLLMPNEKLMTKWLPSVRWGSLEFEQNDDPKQSPSLIRLDHGEHSLQAWMNQSTLRSVLEAEGTSWIAAADYYRFPHVQHFHSVASLVQQLQSLSSSATGATVAASMRRASQNIRSHTLAAYRRVLQHVLGFGHIDDSSDSSDSSSCQLSQLTGNWNQMQLGGTCKNGFITQADFLAEPKSSPQVGLHQCLRLCDETAGCEVAVFNGLTCMVYDQLCNATDLRREGDRSGYVAWKRT